MLDLKDNDCVLNHAQDYIVFCLATAVNIFLFFVFVVLSGRYANNHTIKRKCGDSDNLECNNHLLLVLNQPACPLAVDVAQQNLSCRTQ